MQIQHKKTDDQNKFVIIGFFFEIDVSLCIFFEHAGRFNVHQCCNFAKNFANLFFHII